MSQQIGRLRRCCLILSIVVALFTASACNSNSTAKASNDSGEDIDIASAVMCVGDRVNSPTEPFHYSYKYSEAGAALVPLLKDTASRARFFAAEALGRIVRCRWRLADDQAAARGVEQGDVGEGAAGVDADDGAAHARVST